MLEFNVVQLLKSLTGETRDFEFEERSEHLEREVGVRGPISGKARLIRTQRGILVDAEYETSVELECGRCLEVFRMPLGGKLEEEFLPQVDVWTGVEVDNQEDDALRIGEDHILDLSEAIRQDILVRLPLRPLCSELCQGLCPQCGAARNSESCPCAPAGSESPFGALAKLLNEDGVTESRDHEPRR